MLINGRWLDAASHANFKVTNPANGDRLAEVTDGVAIGPLINQHAIDKVDRQVADAVDRGAAPLRGGARLLDGGLDKGTFYAPTVLSDVTTGMLIYREETFGPIAAVVPYDDDDDDVIAMANDTPYGPGCLRLYEPARSRDAHVRSIEFRDYRHQRHQPDGRRGTVRGHQGKRYRP